MGNLNLPEEGKLFCGLLIFPSLDIDMIHKALEDLFGPIDSVSEIFPFDFSDYYAPEMGTGLRRQFVSFEKTVPMDTLAEVKTHTNILEKRWMIEEKRRVNIDPGYLSLSQVVLASTKNFFHRIYLRDGIYAEVTLHYRKKKGWTPFEWTYPDYQSETALSFLSHLRTIYKKR